MVLRTHVWVIIVWDSDYDFNCFPFRLLGCRVNAQISLLDEHEMTNAGTCTECFSARPFIIISKSGNNMLLWTLGGRKRSLSAQSMGLKMVWRENKKKFLFMRIFWTRRNFLFSDNNDFVVHGNYSQILILGVFGSRGGVRKSAKKRNRF